MAKYPVGIELYSIRDLYAQDLMKALETVKAMGCDYVEFFGGFQYSTNSINEGLAKTGMSCVGWHTPVDMLTDDKIDETIAFNQALGNPYIVIPALPGDMTGSVENWKKTAQLFNQIAAKLRTQGMYLGYHNHTEEFVPLEDGTVPWDILFSTVADDVIMQVDTGNVLCSGHAEPSEIVRRYPGRSTIIHMKPYSLSDGYDVVIGKDDVNWPEVVKACEEAGGTKYFTLEYENQNVDEIAQCTQALIAMLQ